MTAAAPTLADRITVLQDQAAARLPAEVRAVFGAQAAALAGAGIPDGVAAVGTAMPDGDLLDAHGQPTTLAATRAGEPAVVVFYRGAWCPFCNLTLRTYQASLVAELERRGVALIAVSPQRPDGALSMQDRNELTFAVLSDPGNQLGGALGILMLPTGEVRDAQASLGLTVATTNADGTDIVPMPTVVVVDAGGTIRWIDVHPDYTTRTEPAQILGVLELLADDQQDGRNA